MKKITPIAIIISVLAFSQIVGSCSKSDTDPAPSPLPTVITKTVTNITSTSAVSGGTITADGGTAIITEGVCWSTTSGLESIAAAHTNDGTAASFTSNITSLSAHTTYYVKAYATNSSGTGYGNEIIFTTP